MQAVAEKKVAYDLSRFDRRMVVREQVEREKAASAKRTSARKRTRPIISGFSVFCGVVVFVMLSTLLFSYVGLTETSDINRQKREMLEDLREQNQMLSISRDQRMGALRVRDYAVGKLGMSKIDKSQITYVTTSGGDRFEVVGNENENQSKFVSGLVKGFSKIIEYIN